MAGRHRDNKANAEQKLKEIKARLDKQAKDQKRDADLRPGKRQTPMMQDRIK